MKILIKNGHIIDAKTGRDEISDILVENGIISRIDKGIQSAGSESINVDGRYILPGLVDCHCHLRDPGYEYKEDIKSGTRSAAMGGFTSVACMANTDPVIDNEAVVRYILAKSKSDGVVNVFPIGAITKGLRGEELSGIGELKSAGAVAISDDGFPVRSASLMKKAMQYSSMFDIAVISHCEDIDLTDDGLMNEGYISTMLGLKGIPAAAEEVMVAREIALSHYTGVPVHIAHVSTASSVEIIRDAKRKGIKVTAETCPHYFTLTDEACADYNTFARVNPPLRGRTDVAAIIEGLKDGTIDIISTDHAPHHRDEKNVEFAQAANGISGFETAFALASTYLVKPGILTVMELVEKMSYAPSRLLRLDKGSIEIGNSADLIIADMGGEWTVDPAMFKSKGRNTPFGGYRLTGMITHTLTGGRKIVEERKLLC